MPATTTDDIRNKPVQATSTKHPDSKTSVRNDKGPSPKARKTPMSSHSTLPKPIFQSDKAPRLLTADTVARRFHIPGHTPSGRNHPDRQRRCNSDSFFLGR